MKSVLAPPIRAQIGLRVQERTHFGLQTSDQSIKTDVQSVSTDDCLTMLTNIEAKTYLRTDLETTDKRIGFIAQDIKEYMPEEFANIIGIVNAKNGQLIGLDYSRLTPILWTLVKDLSTRLEALENNSST